MDPQVDLRRLKEEAARAYEAGNLKKALPSFLALERLEPQDPAWSRRAADVFRRLDRKDELVSALVRAADKHSRAGELIKAIAVCKQILEIDPKHSQTQQRLAALHSVPIVRGKAAVSPSREPARDDTGLGHNLREDKDGGADAPLETSSGPIGSGHADAQSVWGGRMVSFPLDSIELNKVVKGAEPARAIAAPPPRSAEQSARGGQGAPALAKIKLVRGVALPVAEGTPAGAPPPAPPPKLAEGIFEIPLHAVEEHELDLDIEEAAEVEEVIAATNASPVAAEAPAAAPAAAAPPPWPVALDGAMPPPVVPAQVQASAGPPGVRALDNELESATEAILRAHFVLPSTPLFSALGHESLVQLINKVRLVELVRDQVLFRQGDAADALFVVAEGSVGVFAEGPPRVMLSRLGEGAFLGEIALITEQPRSASVQALEPSRLLAIDRQAVTELIRAEPSVLPVLLKFLSERLLDRLFQTSPLFTRMAPEERPRLAAYFRFLEVQEGALLIEEGKPSEALLVVVAGQLAVTQAEGTPNAKTIATADVGDVCGEISLLGREAATASVRAKRKSLVLQLPAPYFDMVMAAHPEVQSYLKQLGQERKSRTSAARTEGAEFHLELI